MMMKLVMVIPIILMLVMIVKMICQGRFKKDSNLLLIEIIASDWLFSLETW